MGCDIHIYTEAHYDGCWNHVDTLIRNPYWEGTGTLQDSIFGGYLPAPRRIVEHIYDDRNYVLFGVLAGVRDTSLDCIAPPRGLPEDTSDTVREIADFELEHTPTWLTLKELLGYNYWKLPPYEKQWLSHFFSRDEADSTINKLKRIAQGLKVKSDQVRIVFWFDS